MKGLSDLYAKLRLRVNEEKRETTVYRKLRSHGVPERLACAGGAHAGRWWRMAAHGALKTAIPTQLFDNLGIPRLAPH
jgi:hypothetical protein